MTYSTELLAGLDEQQINYLDRCARLRKITRTALLRRLLRVIASDQLVLSVLDDETKPEAPAPKGETVVQAARREHRKTKYNPSAVFRRSPASRSRAEMEDDLRRAVINTGGRVAGDRCESMDDDLCRTVFNTPSEHVDIDE